MKSTMRFGKDKTAATFHMGWHGRGEIVEDTLESNNASPLYRLSLEFNEMTEAEFERVNEALHAVWRKLQ